MQEILNDQTYADWLDSAVIAPIEEIGRSSLGHQEVFEELWDTWQECSQPGWDGYNALNVEQETYRVAYQLIESLPLGFPRPSLGAEPDGHITLEWYKSPSRTISVSVAPDGFLHYAGLFGHTKKYGTLDLFQDAPDDLVQLVQEL